MATEDLKVRLRSDSASLHRGLDKAGRDVKNFSRKGSKSVSQLKKNFDKLHRSVTGIQGAILGLVSAAVLGGLARSFLKAGIAAEKLDKSMAAAAGSVEKGRSAIKFLWKESERLGLVFESSAEAFVGFMAAARGTSLEGQKIRDVFVAVAEASTALQLSSDQTKGALLALQQMISKGTVSSEELRQQLGERLPGAFQDAAKAAGVTTQQLGKLLQQGKILAEDFLPKFAKVLTDKYGGAVESASKTAQANLNRLTNTWLDLRKTVMESGALAAFTEAIKLINKELKTWLETNKELIKTKVPTYVKGLKVAITSVWDIVKHINKWTGGLGLISIAMLGAGRGGIISAGILAWMRVFELLKNLDKVPAGWTKQQFDEIKKLEKNLTHLRALQKTGIDTLGVTQETLRSEIKKTSDAITALYRQVFAAKRSVKIGVVVPDVPVGIPSKVAGPKADVIQPLTALEKEHLRARLKAISDHQKEVAEVAEKFQKAITDAVEEQAEKRKQIQENLANDMGGIMTDSFIEMIRGTKSVSEAFKSMAEEIIVYLLRIALFERIFKPLAQGLVNSFMGPNPAVGKTSPVGGQAISPFTAHKGGIIGKTAFPTRNVDPNMFRNAPRLHSGLSPDEFPAILQRGETVTQKGALPVAPPITINLINESGTALDVEKQDGPRWDGQRWVMEMVLKGLSTNQTFRSSIRNV